MLTSKPFPSEDTRLAVSIGELADVKELAAWHGANNRYTFTVHPSGLSASERRQESAGEAEVETQGEPFAAKSDGMVHVAAWRNKERVRVYVNDQQIWDLPKAVAATGRFNSIMFYVHDVAPEYQYFITNFRLAVGAPDTRRVEFVRM